jgi:hypothetical protein
MRPTRLLAIAFLSACSAAQPDPEPTPLWHDVGQGPLVRVSGHAFVFGSSASSLAGAVISVAEAPKLQTTTGADGTFAFDVPSGGQYSFLLRQPGFHDVQTATFTIDASGLAQVGFQAPTDGIFRLFSGLVGVDLDPERCQIASTVSRAGTEPYGGDALGEPGTIVTIEPPLLPENGPVYFNWIKPGVILPDTTLKETTVDGGVIFMNVPTGEYRLVATKPGKTFTSVKIRCQKGLLVNAAPPWGLQEQ